MGDILTIIFIGLFLILAVMQLQATALTVSPFHSRRTIAFERALRELRNRINATVTAFAERATRLGGVDVAELLADPDFAAQFGLTVTPDSQTALLDEDLTILAHSDGRLVGVSLAGLPQHADATRIVRAAVEREGHAEGFYAWVDGEEMYMNVFPLDTMTRDGKRLFYAYAQHVRSIPGDALAFMKSLPRD